MIFYCFLMGNCMFFRVLGTHIITLELLSNFLALFPACRREGRTVQRIRGESVIRQAFALMSLAYSTHPVFASLDHPLFAARKEGFRNLFL